MVYDIFKKLILALSILAFVFLIADCTKQISKNNAEIIKFCAENNLVWNNKKRTCVKDV